MSSSRLRDQAPTIFDVFCEIVSNPAGDADVAIETKPMIMWKYPDDFNDERTLRSLMEFAFPTTLANEDAVQLFTFVLTDLEGRYSFGYCRHTPSKRSCFCVLSALPWTDIFYRLLNHVAGLNTRSVGRLTSDAESLLIRAYHTEIPGSGERLTLDSGLGSGNRVEFVCPDDKLLPRIPDDRNLTEYYNAVREENMFAVFASLLYERRLIFTSSKLGKLSACVLAASKLLYPMYWQHIFIPVLPDHLVHYLHAPMPFLIGVPTSTLAKIQGEHIDLSEVIVLNIDQDEFASPFDDLSELPGEVVHVLKKNLRSSNHLLGDGVARSFLRALVVLLGGYREALRFRQGETITFSEEAFVQSRPASLRRFLEKMLHMQIFRQFVEERLATLNSGEDPRDEFEEECSLYSSKEYNRYKAQYNEWMGNMRKEGGALFNRVKIKGRDAFSDLRSFISDMKESPATKSVDRRTPSPSILRGIRSSSGGRSPKPNSKHNGRARSQLLKEELDSLKDDVNAREEPTSSLFDVKMDLLSELQYLMARPNSFIEKFEQQHKLRASPTSNSASAQKSENIEPLVSIADAGRPREPSPADEALLIDFGPPKLDAAELDIADFDPLVSKSLSAPVSPNKQSRKTRESTTINDLRSAAGSIANPTPPTVSSSYSNPVRHWETFE